MIIGHGDIASVIKDREDLIYFASGVSNSGETRESEYQREIDLLMDQDTNRYLVYFSSLSVFSSDTRYAEHKKYMEELVKRNFDFHCIIRLGNITWGKNPHTFLNYIKGRIESKKPYEVWDAYRYMVDIEEFQYWLNLIPEWSCEMNIPGKRMKVKEIIDEYI